MAPVVSMLALLGRSVDDYDSEDGPFDVSGLWEPSSQHSSSASDASSRAQTAGGSGELSSCEHELQILFNPVQKSSRKVSDQRKEVLDYETTDAGNSSIAFEELLRRQEQLSRLLEAPMPAKNTQLQTTRSSKAAHGRGPSDHISGKQQNQRLQQQESLQNMKLERKAKKTSTLERVAQVAYPSSTSDKNPHWLSRPSSMLDRAEEENQQAGRFTFQAGPQLYHSYRHAEPESPAPRYTHPTAASRGQRAQSASKARHHESQSEEDQSRSSASRKRRPSMGGSEYPTERELRIEQLAQPRRIDLEWMEQERFEKQEAELRECTFQPQTGRAPSTGRVRPKGDVHERLYSARPAWEQKRSELLAEHEARALSSCTFKPAVNTSRSMRACSARSSQPYVPIHERLGDVLRSRNEKLLRAKAEEEQRQSNATFRPTVLQRSKVLAARREALEDNAHLDVGSRLYALSARKKQPGMQVPELGWDKGPIQSGSRGSVMSMSTSGRWKTPTKHRDIVPCSDQECTFAPAINRKSGALLESSNLPSNFLDRQAYLAALAAEKRELYSRLLDETERPFRHTPHHRPGSIHVEEDMESAVQRLAVDDARELEAKRAAISEAYYSQFPYSPYVNRKSRIIGRSHSVTDLHRGSASSQSRERAAQAEQERQDAECTFQPAINPLSRTLAAMSATASIRSSSDLWQQAQRYRKQQLEQERKAREVEELKECTFRPAVCPKMPEFVQAAAPVVPGLNRHLELQQLARRQAEERAQRERTMFQAQPRSPTHLFTVPKPFSFDKRPDSRPRSARSEVVRSSSEAMRPASSHLPGNRFQAQRAAAVESILRVTESRPNYKA